MEGQRDTPLTGREVLWTLAKDGLALAGILLCAYLALFLDVGP